MVPHRLSFVLAGPVLALLPLCLGGCLATSSTSPAHMASPDYQERDAIRGSLFPSDQAALSDADIDQILSGRIELPRETRLAVLSVAGQASHWGRPQDDANVAAALTEPLGACPRLRDVAILPSLLVPAAPSAASLREAAARFQAGLLLVYRTRSNAYANYRFAQKDQAKARCTVDAILLDVRTGIVPFSCVASSEFVVVEQREDFGLRETWRRGETQALKEALAQVAADLTAFLNAVP